jgi:hypothetical protein
MLKNYQQEILLDNLYQVNLKSPSGLGEALNPRYLAIGGTISIYGSEEVPTGLQLSNIGTKMSLLEADSQNGTFDSIPNYIAIVEQSPTVTSVVLSCLELGTPTAIPA